MIIRRPAADPSLHFLMNIALGQTSPAMASEPLRLSIRPSSTHPSTWPFIPLTLSHPCIHSFIFQMDPYLLSANPRQALCWAVRIQSVPLPAASLIGGKAPKKPVKKTLQILTRQSGEMLLQKQVTEKEFVLNRVVRDSLSTERV